MLSFDIIMNGKVKKMKGQPAGNYFGVDMRLGKGWFITHLPSGFLLTSAVFASCNDAIYFSGFCEQAYGDLLAPPDERCLLDNRYTNEKRNQFFILRNRIEDLDGLITKEIIDEGLCQVQITCRQ